MIFINAVGIICALGDDPEGARNRLLQGDRSGMHDSTEWLNRQRGICVGSVEKSLPALPPSLAKYDCRNNRLLFSAFEQIKNKVDEAIVQFGNDRIGIVLGTSTSGIAAGEEALDSLESDGCFPDSYQYVQQEVGALSECLSVHLDLKGPAFTISTACSSSARAFISAEQLIEGGVCDAVLVGGVDTLCKLTLNGFDGLESLSAGRCNPLSLNRDGINIGEGAALFLLSRDPDRVALLGTGESSDAYHVSAPDPEGVGAEKAMRMALANAKLEASNIGYLNLHGTATKLNDLMESKAVSKVLGPSAPCSSTKPLTGHTLGAAGAIEAALCWLVLTQPGEMKLPPHLWDEIIDPELPEIKIVKREDILAKPICMSNSFAFGGNNVSLIFGVVDD
jgi:3-oxoacyl-[acyl-carrier-protein] synthase-1